MSRKLGISPAAPLFWIAAAALEPNVRLVCVAAALALHELAHLAAIRLCGGSVERIRVLPAGLEIVRAPGLTSYKADAVISAAGPAVSLAAGAAALFCGGVLRFFGAANAVFGAINALPVAGLDGGSVLAALASAHLPPDRARRLTCAVSVVFSILIWLAAVWILLATASNISLLLLAAAVFCSSVFGGG